MAIAFVRQASLPATSEVESLTLSFDATGCDFLRIAVHWGLSMGQVPDSVTFNGVAATLIKDSGDSANKIRTQTYKLVAPASGTHNVVATISTSSTDRWAVSCAGYSGVHQTTPTGSSGSAVGEGPTASTSATLSSGDLLVDAVSAWEVNTDSLTAGGGQTERINSGVTISSGPRYGVSEKGGTGSVSVSWAIGSELQWAHVADVLKPAASGTDVTVNPTGLSMTATLGTPTVAINAIAVSPTGFGMTSTLGTPSVTTGSSVTQNPTGFGMTVSLGTPSLVVSVVSITPTGMSMTATLGASFVIENDITLIGMSLPEMIVSLGTPTVSITNTQSPTVTPSGFGMTSSLGTPSVFQSGKQVAPTGLSMTATLGVPNVNNGNNPNVIQLTTLMQLGGWPDQ